MAEPRTCKSISEAISAGRVTGGLKHSFQLWHRRANPYGEASQFPAVISHLPPEASFKVIVRRGATLTCPL
jgi:hypothetical protein